MKRWRRARRKKVDKPYPNFVRVAKPHRRNGYGTALYYRMAKELKDRFGLRLWASAVQCDCARKVWATLNYEETENGRRVLGARSRSPEGGGAISD